MLIIIKNPKTNNTNIIAKMNTNGFERKGILPAKPINPAKSKNITINMLTIIAIFLFSIISPCLYYHIIPD